MYESSGGLTLLTFGVAIIQRRYNQPRNQLTLKPLIQGSLKLSYSR